MEQQSIHTHNKESFIEYLKEVGASMGVSPKKVSINLLSGINQVIKLLAFEAWVQGIPFTDDRFMTLRQFLKVSSIIEDFWYLKARLGTPSESWGDASRFRKMEDSITKLLKE